MKSAALQWAALCVCPPAILATTVATVPPVKRAVHHATRPAPAKPKVAKTRTKHVKSAAVAAGVPCDSIPGVPVPALLAYARPMPTVGAGDIIGPAIVDPPRFTPAVVPPVPGIPGVGIYVPPNQPILGVPEPGTWLLLISGFGLLGMGLRWRRGRTAALAAGAPLSGSLSPAASTPAALDAPRRRRRSRRAKKAGGLSSVMAALGFGEVATGSASLGTIAAKAMMCVCPTAAIVAGTMATPPLRTAVYKATAMPAPAPPVVATLVKPPCDPTLRSAEADAPPSRIIDEDQATPQVATALLASTAPSVPAATTVQ